MRWMVITLYVVVGLINAFPLIGVLGADRLEALYGVPIVDADHLLLMRHRAVLLGLVGGLLLVAAFRPALRPVASVIALVSMLVFLALALPIAEHGAALQRVFWADAGAVVLLVAAMAISIRGPGPA